MTVDLPDGTVATVKLSFTPVELRNIATHFICNVLDNVQRRADWDGDYKWGKEDASHLVVTAVDTFRTLDDDMWQSVRNDLLERYKGR